jgi:hypothetical protein
MRASGLQGQGAGLICKNYRRLKVPVLMVFVLALGGACRRAPSVGDSGTQEAPSEYRGVAVAPLPHANSVAIGGELGDAAGSAGFFAPTSSSDLRGLRVILERKVNTGGATDVEVRMLAEVCRMLGDEACRSGAERIRERRRENDWTESQADK